MTGEAEQAVRRAQRLLHSLDVDNSAANRSEVLAGLRHEVDTLAVLAGLPLQIRNVGVTNNPVTCEDVPLPLGFDQSTA